MIRLRAFIAKLQELESQLGDVPVLVSVSGYGGHSCYTASAPSKEDHYLGGFEEADEKLMAKFRQGLELDEDGYCDANFVVIDADTLLYNT